MNIQEVINKLLWSWTWAEARIWCWMFVSVRVVSFPLSLLDVRNLFDLQYLLQLSIFYFQLLSSSLPTLTESKQLIFRFYHLIRKILKILPSFLKCLPEDVFLPESFFLDVLISVWKLLSEFSSRGLFTLFLCVIQKGQSVIWLSVSLSFFINSVDLFLFQLETL